MDPTDMATISQSLQPLLGLGGPKVAVVHVGAMALAASAAVISFLWADMVRDLPAWLVFLALLVVPFWIVAPIYAIPRLLDANHPRLAIAVGIISTLAAGFQGHLMALLLQQVLP